MKVTVINIAMERLTIELMIFAGTVVTVDDRCFIVCAGVPLILCIMVRTRFNILVLVFSSVKWHSLVHVVVLNSARRLRLNLVEQLVILVLYISHQSLSMVMGHIMVVAVVITTVSIQPTVFIIGALNLATMVLSFSVLLVVERGRVIDTMVQDILLLCKVRVEVWKLVSSFLVIRVVRCFIVWTILVMHDFLACVQRMMINMVLVAMLVRPEQLLVTGLSLRFLDSMTIMVNLMMRSHILL